MNGLFPVFRLVRVAQSLFRIIFLLQVFLSKLSDLTHTVYADCYRCERTFLSTNERHEIRIVSAITINFKQ